MILIFGVRSYLKALAMLTLACRNGHVAAHRLLKVTRKFSLFFVPLFPIQTRYYTVCTHCGLWVPWNKEDAEAAAVSSSLSSSSSSSSSFTAASAAGRGGDAQPGAGPEDAQGAIGSAQPGSVAPADPVAPPLRPVTALPLAPPTANPGWYPDPAGEGEFRYWDGGSWTQAVRGGPGT
jgi:hypothetical protein